MIWTPPKTWEKIDSINVPDWQRIDDNTRWIAEFYGVTLPYKTWAHTDFPTPMEMARIQSNIEALIKYFQGVYTGSRIEISQKFSGEMQSLTVTGQTLETGAGDKSPNNPYTLTGTTALTVADGGSNARTITLPQPLYSLPNGTEDSFDIVSGTGVQNVGVLILDGTRSGTQWLNKSATLGVWFDTPGLKNGSWDKVNPAYCSHFKNVAPITLSGTSYVDPAIAVWDSSSHIMMQIPFATFGGSSANTAAQNLALLKVWLAAQYSAGTPVTVLYELAEPQAISGTPQTIPTYYPYTQIVNDAGAEMTAVIKGDNHSFQTKFDWNLLNDIESLLLEMHAKVVELQLSVRRSGTFVSGHETYIPLGGT